MVENYEKVYYDKIKLSDYIIKHNGIFKIPNLYLTSFNEDILLKLKNKSLTTEYLNNPRNHIQIRYNSLIRFFLYIKLLRYSGNDPIILSYIDGIKNNDSEKIEMINKIPNNLIVMRTINKTFNLEYVINHDFSDLQKLKKLIYNQEIILDDKYLKEYIRIVVNVSAKSKKSENIVKSTIDSIYGKKFDIEYSNISEDLKGVDIWKTNKETGIKNSIQVKNISTNSIFTLNTNLITIDFTNLDLQNYNSYNQKLSYDYLYFYIEKYKQIYIVKSSAIHSILNYKKCSNNKIIIELKESIFISQIKHEEIKIINITDEQLLQ